MKNNTLQPSKEDNTITVELEPDQNVCIKCSDREIKLDPLAIDRLADLQENDNDSLNGYLENLADIICMIVIREENCRQNDEKTKEAILNLSYLRDYLKCLKRE